MSVSKKKKGSIRIRPDGRPPKTGIRTSNSKNEIQKSMAPGKTAETGATNRGKYTFEIRFEFPARLFDDCDSPFAKKVQGRSAVRIKRGYGMPSDGIFARRP